MGHVLPSQTWSNSLADNVVVSAAPCSPILIPNPGQPQALIGFCDASFASMGKTNPDEDPVQNGGVSAHTLTPHKLKTALRRVPEWSHHNRSFFTVPGKEVGSQKDPEMSTQSILGGAFWHCYRRV